MSSSTSELDGVQKAAILLITLGPEKAAGIFKHLKEDEIEQLTLEIANTRSVTPAEKEQVLNEFYESALLSSILRRVVLVMPKIFCRKPLVRTGRRRYWAN